MRSLQCLGNLLVIGLLRSPFHGLASRSLILIAYRGRSSGRRFTLPVMYAERGGILIVLVGHPEQKRWWRNLRDGAEVDVWLCGQRQRRHADIVNDQAAVDTYLDRYPRARSTLETTDSPTFVRLTALTTKSSAARR
jgi:hypothetical protein